MQTQSFLFFFFSSRRRHTRSKRDWSSDVCSSDLRADERGFIRVELGNRPEQRVGRRWAAVTCIRVACRHELRRGAVQHREHGHVAARSEERRVGKEWSAGGSAGHYEEKGVCTGGA